jgi:hypothetical protein
MQMPSKLLISSLAVLFLAAGYRLEAQTSYCVPSAWGTWTPAAHSYADCDTKLEYVAPNDPDTPDNGEPVILIHGIYGNEDPKTGKDVISE